MENFLLIFEPTISQMAVLLIFMLIGYLMGKTKVAPESSIGVLSKFETTLFLPAVLLGVFMKSFTINNLSSYVSIILFSIVVCAVCIVIGLLIPKLLVKDDKYLRNLYQYSLIYSNFSYVGIPIIQAVKPDLAIYYLVFTIVFHFSFSLWALPSLLIPKKDDEQVELSFWGKVVKYLKVLVNPIFIALIAGAILGLITIGDVNFYVWLNTTKFSFINDVISQTGNCMSVVAMLIAGLVIAKYDIKSILKRPRIYIASILRLIVIPVVMSLIFILITKLFNFDGTIMLWCIIVFSAMPLGLNSVIIPASYGKDTSEPAGMALVSSLLGIITIPVIMALIFAI